MSPGPDRWLALQSALDEGATDALLAERERAVRAAVREVVATEVEPRAAAADRDHTFVHESYQALAKAGLAGLLLPAELGGTGDSTVSYAVAMEEITAGCAATSLVYMTQMHAAYPITAVGSDSLARRYVPGLAEGRAYGALAITEPDAGSDVSALRTVATAAPGGYRISGAKMFITTGDRADVIVCFATVDRSRGRDGITAFLLDGDSPGLSRGTPLRKMGMHGSSTAELFLDAVDVPAEHLLGTPGQGWRIVMDSVTKTRISAAAQGVGLARSAYARALCALREVHGTRLPPETAAGLAEIRGRILQGRLLLLAIARQVDTGAAVAPGEIGIMKQACTDLGWWAARTAVRLLGDHGDLAELGVERCLRDAKVTQIYDGTNEVQRMLIARDTARRVGEL